jgi:tellurite methyltransferase
MTIEMDEKSIWNKKYSEGSHSSLVPDPFLASAYDEFLSSRPAGIALDVAGGAGRHAVWLAERGWRVTLLDISEAGVAQARENAQKLSKGLITAEVVDLNATQDLGREQYDLVLVIRFLQRQLFPALIAALKPGGHLIYKTYTTHHQAVGGGRLGNEPNNPAFLLQPNELLHTFASLRVLHYHETTRNQGVAELVAQKYEEIEDNK